MAKLTRTTKQFAVLEAAQHQNFSDAIEDIDTLTYTDKDGKVWEDRFDYIDTTVLPCSVRFIAGTGHENPCIPLSSLTDESIDTLYNAINK